MKHIDGGVTNSLGNFGKETRGPAKKCRNAPGCGSTSRKRIRRNPLAAVWVDIADLGDDELRKNNGGPLPRDGGGVRGIPLLSASTGKRCCSMCLEPGIPYTIGRSPHHSHFVFADSRVSKQHCQILFDSSFRKLYLLDGIFSFPDTSTNCIVDEYRNILTNGYAHLFKMKEGTEVPCKYSFRPSLNGVYINGVRVGDGCVRELSAGDEVMLVCTNVNGTCGSQSRIGFIIQRIVFKEEVPVGGISSTSLERQCLSKPKVTSKIKKRVLALSAEDSESLTSGCADTVGRMSSLVAHCRQILHSDDPISCIRACSLLDDMGICSKEKQEYPLLKQSDGPDFHASCELPVKHDTAVSVLQKLLCDGPGSLRNLVVPSTSDEISSEVVPQIARSANLCEQAFVDAVGNNRVVLPSSSSKNESAPSPDCTKQNKGQEKLISPPGRGFYLNRLHSMQSSTFNQQKLISLQELLYPVDSISRIFIATFTSDLPWFLSCCDIPHQLPVTIACHSAESCWSASPEKRSSVPYADFPNLVVVFPPFPEAIAFGKDRKRQGVACHHPKLLVLQREDSIRVIVTSANLVEKQWSKVTNTIWWQDFPRRSAPDYFSLFTKLHDRVSNDGSGTDFAAQLAGFMATLITDVPSQAHWIDELSKYDFGGAEGYLVSSVPGVHSHRSLSENEDISFLPSKVQSSNLKFLGSVEASVVGLSHLFRTAVDSNGTALKKLAVFLGNYCEKAYGVSEIVLRRSRNVPADVNAVSILVPNPKDSSEEDSVQLGFLPRDVAKWVSPLWDAGFFSFLGYIYPKEALAAALEGSGVKVQLILRVAQGPNFLNISKMMQPEYVVALCSLIASLKRCTGLWRLEEVLDQYKWPEILESDFVYGASSIGGSVSPQFLAAFSAAAGKKSVQAIDSDESDPEWGCWKASHERQRPSIRIVFPTIERVKNAHDGILPSKYMLCFTEKTWQKLKPLDILYDAAPHPSCRVGHPMHAKVARRRFQSKRDGSPFGWVYCGSHNLSAAAWGRQISSSSSRVDRSKSGSSSDMRLHVCNYELGIIFIYPPHITKGGKNEKETGNIDDIELPFKVPPAKYGYRDRPATQRAMREALNSLAEQEQTAAEAGFIEEMVDEDEEANEVGNEHVDVAEEKEDEKAYAEMLWCQVDAT